MEKKSLTGRSMAGFTGTETWYPTIMPGITYTEGVKHVAEAGGAYWLIDEVATAQMLKPVAGEEFQVWTLTVNRQPATALLTCGDGNGNVVYRKEIAFTDFPLDAVTFWYTDRVVMLPTEY